MPQFNSTASIVPITIFGGKGQIAFLPPGVLTSSFNVTGSAVDTLINQTSSFVMEFETGSTAFQFRIPSESAKVSTDIIPLHVTSSGENPLIGFGTKTPQSTLDIRSITSSSPANILLRTNEDGVIQVGEETGRIEFAIESASYLGTDFVVSGSTAAMFSRVVESSAVGAIGNLVFTVNKSLGTATTPIDAVVIGKGATSGFDGIGMAISGNMEIASAAPLLSVRNDNGTEIARLGGHSPLDFSDGQLLLYNQNTQSVKFNGDESPADASFIKFGNLALGGTTAGERLTVTGSISISGSGVGHITASGNISASGDITANSFTGTVTTATTASYVQASNVDGTVPNASTASYVAGGNVDGDVASATDATNSTNTFIGNSDGSSAYFVTLAASTGNQPLKRDAGIQYDSSADILDISGKIYLGSNNLDLRSFNDNLLIHNGGLHVGDGPITASGDISSSSDIYAAKIKPTKIELEVTSTTDGDANGDIVYFGGTTSMDVGQIYNLNSAGGWTKAQANSQANSDALLAVALGAASDTNGMLLKGMVTLDHDPGTIGDPLYLSDGTAGQATSTAPNSTNDIVRLIGYCVDSTNGQIYFNPSNDFIVHAGE